LREGNAFNMVGKGKQRKKEGGDVKGLARFLPLAMVMAMGTPLLAGGLWFSLRDPQTVPDEPPAKGLFAALRVSFYNGEGVEDANISGTAEGLINHQRVSIPVTIAKLSGSGLYGIWWDRPNDGIWVLSIKVWGWAFVQNGPGFADPSGHGIGPDLFAVDPEGVKIRTVKPMLSSPPRSTGEDVESTLGTLASSGSVSSQPALEIAPRGGN
jgi:hypothetical protein